ncbi:uncharacterized protein si:dkey-225f5.4 [Mugil cephalus]|uniref:uncharacterized protein si:dkey-225f5.4 n=1 Tax=Mugil cephalus TaxID=48193 RepID=UPI001FB66B9E|nr:uncharacterized protein si:dkey-225f5.4 [Mugil cephalus]
MADVRAVLQRCDPSLLDPSGDSESDCAEAAGMVLYLTDSRRVQKVLWRQLFVLDSMMSLLEGLDSAQQLMTQSSPPQPEGGARGRWKALKAEIRSGVEETEALLRSLQDKVQQIHSKRHTLTHLVQQLRSKKQQCDQLGESLQKAQNALRSCDHRLTQLKAESEAALAQLTGWQRLRAELQRLVPAVQGLMQVNLLSFNKSELSVEFRSRPSSNLSACELEPLKVSVNWSHDDRFTLQANECTVGLQEDWMLGRRAELGATLLEAMQCYQGQAELLTEIQALRSSFAIDWNPAQRLLIYLKSASLVCHLEVEEGYPSSGTARLLSVRRDGKPLDTSVLKPPKTDLSLTKWLVFLCSSDLI